MNVSMNEMYTVLPIGMTKKWLFVFIILCDLSLYLYKYIYKRIYITKCLYNA